MALPMLTAFLFASVALVQESVVPPAPRVPLPRPVANAPMAQVNDNRRPAGTLSGGTLTLSLDIVEAAYQPEGEHDPVVRDPGVRRAGKGARRSPARCSARRWERRCGSSLRNRSDSAVMLGRPPALDARRSRHGARRRRGDARGRRSGSTRVGNFFYWGALKGLTSYRRSLLARFAAHGRAHRRCGGRTAARRRSGSG